MRKTYHIEKIIIKKQSIDIKNISRFVIMKLIIIFCLLAISISTKSQVFVDSNSFDYSKTVRYSENFIRCRYKPVLLDSLLKSSDNKEILFATGIKYLQEKLSHEGPIYMWNEKVFVDSLLTIIANNSNNADTFYYKELRRRSCSTDRIKAYVEALDKKVYLDSRYNLEDYFVKDYGDKADQTYQLNSYDSKPICFIGFKQMWLNNFCNNNVLNSLGYGQIDAESLDPPITKWKVTQNSYISLGNNKPGKLFINAFLDKNQRITKCQITANNDDILINLFVLYWKEGVFDRIEFKKTFKAVKYYISDQITLSRINGKLTITITQSPNITIPHNN
jgi:hypothetical protein